MSDNNMRIFSNKTFSWIMYWLAIAAGIFGMTDAAIFAGVLGVFFRILWIEDQATALRESILETLEELADGGNTSINVTRLEDKGDTQ